MRLRSLSRWLETDTYSPRAIDTGAADDGGQAGGEDGTDRGGGPGDADHHRGGGDDAVVGAEHAGAQPVEPLGEAAGALGRLARCG